MKANFSYVLLREAIDITSQIFDYLIENYRIFNLELKYLSKRLFSNRKCIRLKMLLFNLQFSIFKFNFLLLFVM